jgi:hypothetical protein
VAEDNIERDVTLPRPARYKKDNEIRRDLSKNGACSRKNIRGRENMDIKDFFSVGKQWRGGWVTRGDFGYGAPRQLGRAYQAC